MAKSDHPFLSEATLPQWSRLTPDHIVPDIGVALTHAQKAVDAIASQDPTRATFSSAILALECATENLSSAWGAVGHLNSVSDSPALREAYKTMLPQVSDFYSNIPLNPDLWRVIKAAAEKAPAGTLGHVEQRLLDETLADFREQGADLPAEQQKRIARINAALAETTQKFSENVLDATNAWEKIITDESLLSGLPSSARNAARQDAQRKGHGSTDAPAYRFTLHAPSYIPVIQYADDSALRKEIWEAANQVGRQGGTNNLPLMREILILRKEKANLLGKSHFADLVLARRMARDGQTALDFIENLFSRVKAPFDEDFRRLEAFFQKHSDENRPLEPWDVAYWSEKQRQAEYEFDEEALRPFFPITSVITGLFQLAKDVFGLEVQPLPSRFIDPNSTEYSGGDASAEPLPEVWHPDVQLYALKDVRSGDELGLFYTDWYPRESKRGGAWMNYLKTGERAANRARTPHLGLIAGNLTPSVGDQPACLTHREVETIFHEFGHLIHHLCGEVSIKSLNGVNVAWDFVELPSQIMENWCWERLSLDLFARHVETGDPIPEDLFQKMLKARNFQSAAATMRQLALGKLDLGLHTHPDPASIDDLDAAMRRLIEDYLPPLATPTPSIAPRFTHLFASSVGYAAGYYSYKWAEVLDADAFSRFLAEGILNPDTGREFRDTILAQGNSLPPQDLFRAFMGRDPNPEALLQRAGLTRLN